MANQNQPTFDLKGLDGTIPDGKQINLGDGLRVLVRAGKKQFQARFRSNGTDTTVVLGFYPEMSIDEARRRKDAFIKTKADQIAKGVPPVKQRRSKREIQSREIEKNYILQTEKQCWDFLKFFCRLTGVSLEEKHAILLMLTIPASPRELIEAKWSDLQSDKLILSKSRKPLSKKIETQKDYAGPYKFRSAFISRAAGALFSQLQRPNQEQTYIFPTLQGLGAEQAERKLDDLLRDIWKDGRLKAKNLQYTFEHLALEYSEFKPEFISAVRRKAYKDSERHQRFYNFLVRALVEWWGANLARLMNMEEYKSIYDLSSPQIYISATPFTYPNMGPHDFSLATFTAIRV